MGKFQLWMVCLLAVLVLLGCDNGEFVEKVEIVTVVAFQYRSHANYDCTGCEQIVWEGKRTTKTAFWAGTGSPPPGAAAGSPHSLPGLS